MCKVLIASVVIFYMLFKSGICIERIECYSCLSSENPDCLNPEKHRLEKVKCGMDGLTKTAQFAGRLDPIFAKIFEVQLHENLVPLNCLKQVTKVHGKEVILRGCQLPKDDRLDVCKKVYEIEKKENVQVKYCSLCETDGCNAAPGVALPTHVATIIIAAIAAFR